jgi:MYXO-CTERM domain-containing protein
MERAGVFLQNGHVTAFTFAVSDVEKTTIVYNDNHLTKIIVVPFDGVTFDRENPGPGSAACPLDLGSDDAGSGTAPVDASSDGTGTGADASMTVDAGAVADASEPGDVSTDAATPTDGSASVEVGADAATPTEDGSASVEVDARAGGGAEAGGDAAVTTEGADAGASVTSNASGCGCRTAPGAATKGAAPLALVALGVLAITRRRRKDAPVRL